MGGERFLRVRLEAPAASVAEFDFDYYDGRLLIGPELFGIFGDFLRRAGERRFAEVVRLFLLHEGHHIGQGMGYTSQGVGRAGVALEVADYDADVTSIELCLQWRREWAPGGLRRQGEMGTLCDILDSVLVGLGLFDGAASRGLQRVKERRLRRYLLWHFQRARARAAPPELPAERLRLRERVVLEAPGLPRALGEDAAVDLTRLEEAQDLEIVIYAGGRLYRCREEAFCRGLLRGLREGGGAQVSRVFHQLFEEHPALVPA